MNVIDKNNTKEKIINAALQEFGEKGYERASTNNIVNEAGVGKGMLFYYFKNKEELYRYLVDKGIKAIEAIFENEHIFESNDFLERCMELSKFKMDRYVSDPLLFNFFGNSYLNDINVPELADVIEKEIQMSTRMHDEFYNNLDKSNLRNDVNPEELIKIIKWTIDGYETDLINRLKGQDLTKMDLNPIWDEFEELIENLKILFYK